jgi:hypothetical protein
MSLGKLTLCSPINRALDAVARGTRCRFRRERTPTRHEPGALPPRREGTGPVTYAGAPANAASCISSGETERVTLETTIR